MWNSYNLNDYTVKSGAFVEDSRGRWYVCLVVEIETNPQLTSIQKNKTIGIDLGLKDFATITNGVNHNKIEASKNYRQLEAKLAMAQRANKKLLVKNIHAKIKNKRNDEHHNLSSILVKNNQAIFVGNVSSSKLVKTNLAKSVLDAGWSKFWEMLGYKCMHSIFEYR